MDELLAAARGMVSSQLSIVALDMPVAKAPFDSRRSADSAISKAFGGRGCSTHSPNGIRPGPLGRNLMGQLESQGFPLATASAAWGDGPCTIEVYPHPALLALLARGYRVPYKISRSRKYWPGASVRERVSNVLVEWERIGTALAVVFGAAPIRLPQADDVETLAGLKKYEDTLDALICAWVGARFAERAARPYGSEEAAIWVPEARVF